MRDVVKPGLIEKTYNPAEVAEELRVTRRTVYTWLRSGALPASRIGPKLWYVKESDLRTFIGGHLAKPEPLLPSPVVVPSPAAVQVEQPSLPTEYLPTGSGVLKPVQGSGKKKRRR